MTDHSSAWAQRLAVPGWLNLRLVLGVVLVLGSLVAGARVVASVDRTTSVFVAAHPLVPGERLSVGDLGIARVHLSASAPSYVAAGAAAPIGYVVTRFVGAHELLPVGALSDGESVSRREVAVPVEPGHLPPGLDRGQLVDVYVTAKAASGSGPAPPRLVLTAVPVVSRDGGARGFGGDVTIAVVLAVPADQVADTVRAVESGAIDLVGVPASAAPSGDGAS